MISKWFFQKPINLGDLDIFDRKVSVEDRAACYDAIASTCSREFIPCDGEQLHPVEHPQAHFVISKLLKGDSKFDIRLGDFIVKRCKDQLSSWVIYYFQISLAFYLTYQLIVRIFKKFLLY